MYGDVINLVMKHFATILDLFFSAACSLNLCIQGEEPNSGKTECVACEAGKYQDTVGGGPCDECAVGEFTSTTGQEICAKCEKVRDLFL